MVVLSNNDGCIIARSNEAKALGIPMGAPLHLYKSIIQEHQVECFSANFSLYGDLSNRMMTLLSRFAEEQSVYSIDESFLQWKDYPKWQDLDFVARLGQSIYDSVLQALGLPVTVGFAPTRTLAKLANRIAKKQGLPLTCC